MQGSRRGHTHPAKISPSPRRYYLRCKKICEKFKFSLSRFSVTMAPVSNGTRGIFVGVSRLGEINVKPVVSEQKTAMNSLVAFRKKFQAAPDDVPSPPFHDEWSEILLNGEGHFAIEAFRESAKTQLVIRANLMHALTYPLPWRRYLVVICANQRTASKKLQEISREFEASESMKQMVDKVVVNSGEVLEMQYKPGVKHVRSVRIEAYGKGSAVRGLSWGAKRPDLVIIDDPQDEEDTRSDSVTEADWDWFLSDVMFLGRSTRIFLIGNNLGERCIIEQVINNARELNFTTRRIPIADKKLKFSAWPEKWPVDKIRAEKESYAKLNKLDIWYKNKMCECIAPDSQKFKRSMFKYFEPESLKLSELSVYTTVDLAISQQAGRDYTAVVTMGVNPEGHWFVLDVEYGRYNPTQQMDAIFHAVQRWRPLSVGIEDQAYQASLKHFLEREMPKRNIFFRVEPLRALKKKELRIDTMQPRFSVGSVWFEKDAPWVRKIEGELLAYPHGKHDDVIDALAYMEQLAAAPMTGNFGSWANWAERIPMAGKI